MEHKIFKTLLAVVIATMTFCAEAVIVTVNGIERTCTVPVKMTYTVAIDGIKWTYSVENDKASLGCADGWYFDPAIPKSTSGAISIPSTLGGYPVTSIGNMAFYGCSSLTSVTIPNSVTSIGDYAFPEYGELTIYTDAGNAGRLRVMLQDASHTLIYIVEQGIDWFFWCIYVVILIFISLISLRRFCFFSFKGRMRRREYILRSMLYNLFGFLFSIGFSCFFGRVAPSLFYCDMTVLLTLALYLMIGILIGPFGPVCIFYIVNILLCTLGGCDASFSFCGLAIVVLLTGLPSIALVVRRFHDLGSSGWSAVWLFVPIIDRIALLCLMLKDGEKCTNKYGPNPKASTGEDKSKSSSNHVDDITVVDLKEDDFEVAELTEADFEVAELKEEDFVLSDLNEKGQNEKVRFNGEISNSQKDLDNLREKGLISEEEYKEIRQRIISNL